MYNNLFKVFNYAHIIVYEISIHIVYHTLEKIETLLSNNNR